MAVYTQVSFDEAKQFLQSLQLGTLHNMAGCSGGIENTNYFVTTDQAPYVLTLFERLSAEQLPFYLPPWSTGSRVKANLHLASRTAPKWVPCWHACT